MKKLFRIVLVFAMLFPGSSLFAQVNYSFSALTRKYMPVEGGITPPFVNRPFQVGVSSTPSDEGFANGIPIGFHFKYNGNTYTTVSMNVNGFATLGDPLLTDSILPEAYYINKLSDASFFGLPDFSGNHFVNYPYLKNKPILAPLWDDLDIQTNSNFRYQTTGLPGSRVFTMEWADILWPFDAAAPVLSMELKLYEGNNVIEFCYRDEGGMPNSFASASIGITDKNNLGSILSLHDVSSNPVVSGQENDSINSKPSDNQVYRFTPSESPAPFNLKVISYDNSSVNFKWRDMGSASYDYAVTTSAASPVRSQPTPFSNAVKNGLLPDQGYYIHVRAEYSADHLSDWATIYFKTAGDEASLPYFEGFESASPSMLPENCRAQVKDSLNFVTGYGLPYDSPIATYNDGNADSGSNYLALNSNRDTSAATWFYLPGFNLKAGLTYRLKFDYFPFVFAQGIVNKKDSLSIRMGKETGSAASTINLLNIPIAKLPPIDLTRYNDTALLFSPAENGVYYIGFRSVSGPERFTDMVDDLVDYYHLSLDNISISEVSPDIKENISQSPSVFKLSVFPNPSNGKTTLEIETAEEENITVRLFDAFGRQVYVYNAGNVEGYLAKQMDLTNLSSGIYFMQAEHNGATELRKITLYTRHPK